MKVPLYILGFLMRYGPQHGYLLRQHIEKEASDFAVIRTSNLYYHLERLKKDGYVESRVEQEGRRPDRQVFEITEAGKQHFFTLLRKAARDRFRGEHLFDAVLFFLSYLDLEFVCAELTGQIEDCRRVLAHIQAHRQEVLAHVPEMYAKIVTAIFNHHLYHYEAEYKWLGETLAIIETER